MSFSISRLATVQVSLYIELALRTQLNFTTSISDILPGVVLRRHVSDIKQDLRVVFSIKSAYTMVQVTRLNHRRGSGATTIALNVLWDLKQTYREAQFETPAFLKHCFVNKVSFCDIHFYATKFVLDSSI